jgi:hypothetical protein
LREVFFHFSLIFHNHSPHPSLRVTTQRREKETDKKEDSNKENNFILCNLFDGKVSGLEDKK